MFKMMYIQQAFYYIYYGTNNLISLTIMRLCQDFFANLISAVW